MRLIYFWVVIGSVLASASTVWAAEPGSKQDPLLESFFREYLEAAFRLEPMLATRLGDHRFDDQLDDLRAPRGRPGWITIAKRWPNCAAGSITRRFRETVRSITRFSRTISRARSG